LPIFRYITVRLGNTKTARSGSTHSVDMKYIGSNLGSAESPPRVAKMIKSFAKLMNYDQ
jgi:hypothetical protein